jgi:mono/diheme cytochrome c family protein
MGEWIGDGRLWRGWRLLAGGALVAALVLLLASCGGSKSAPAARDEKAAGANVVQTASDRFAYARARFREMCAGCHTLADAGAHGRRFNLDHEGGTPKELVVSIIRDGGPGMPAWGPVLSKREYQELVAYVLLAERGKGPENGWEWQIHLRMEGEQTPATLSVP